MVLSSLPLLALCGMRLAAGNPEPSTPQIRGRTVTQQRNLDFQRIVGYEPRTQVTDQAALDLDQAAFEQELFLGKFLKARTVYQEGGYSMSYAVLKLSKPTGPAHFVAGTEVVGVAPSGGEVAGTLMEDASWKNHTAEVSVKVLYYTSDVQEKYVGCQVGGLYTFSAANLDGCFNDTGHAVFIPPGQSKEKHIFTYSYNIRVDNANARTLQSMSTDTNTTMKKDKVCSVCPFIDEFQKFVDFYGDTNYADKWIVGASYNKTTAFTSGMGDADFTVFAYKAALAAAQAKGTVLMTVFMAVIEQMEKAVLYCDQHKKCANCTTNDPIAPLDAAVAYYAGSLQGDDGSGDGKMYYDATNRMALHFSTCGESGTDELGTAWVNGQVVTEFQRFQSRVLKSECGLAKQSKDMIVNLMKVPLVQGVLQYAHLRQYENPVSQEYSEQAEAEGATFAAALLPFVHACNPDDAATIYENMRVGSSPSKLQFAQVKTALERNYGCLGVTCASVGGVYTVDGYAVGAEPCTFDAPASGSSASNSGVAAGATIGVVCGLVLFGFLYIRARSRKAKRDAARRSSNIAAVSEIS